MRDLRRRGLIYQGRMCTKVSENLAVGNRTVSPVACGGPLGVRDDHRDGQQCRRRAIRDFSCFADECERGCLGVVKE